MWKFLSPTPWHLIHSEKLKFMGALSLLVSITCSWGSCLGLQGQPPGQLWAGDHCLHRPSMELRVDRWELWRAGVCLNSPELSPRLWLTVRPPGGYSDWFLTFNHSVKTGAPCRTCLGAGLETRKHIYTCNQARSESHHQEKDPERHWFFFCLFQYQKKVWKVTLETQQAAVPCLCTFFPLWHLRILWLYKGVRQRWGVSHNHAENQL